MRSGSFVASTGFRIDVAHGLLKHPDFLDNPLRSEIPEGAGPLETFFSYDHTYDMDQDGNLEIFTRWQDVARPYDACLLAETGVTDPHRLARYVGDGALDLAFFLKPGWLGWEPETFVRELTELAAIEPDGVSWVISNHDQARPASRFGDGAVGSQPGHGRDHDDVLARWCAVSCTRAKNWDRPMA